MLSRREFLSASVAASASLQGQSSRRPPNIVLIFLDDSGFSDFPPFGNPAYPTPNVQRLARQGCAFRNFYVPQAVCSASRAALMTGCYPGRTKVFGAHAPRARGLDPKFATMGEVLKKAGYATSVFGKWHLGDQPETRPHVRGFDESCGLMYSNDMWENNPTNPARFRGMPLQFWENGKVTIEPVTAEHQPMLTTWYTEHAVRFITRHKNSPFLLYLPHTMPHVPLFRSKKFEGKSGAGVYGDVMMEIDWSVGEVLNTLARHNLENDTLVILTSDNGPWRVYGNHAGKTPFRESKLTSFDGGIHSACLMRYPGRIAANSVSTRTFCSVDLMPTIASLAGAPLPDYPIDGINFWDYITGKPDARNPHRYYPFSTGPNFEGVISADGRWKLHVPHRYQKLIEEGHDGLPGKTSQESIERSLFDLMNDPLETRNVAADQPDVAAELERYAEEHRREFYPPA